MKESEGRRRGRVEGERGLKEREGRRRGIKNFTTEDTELHGGEDEEGGREMREISVKKVTVSAARTSG